MKKRKQRIKTTSIIITLFFFIGCAVAPSKVKPSYISPVKYSNYDCDQLQAEYNRLTKELTGMTKKQQDAYSCDTVSFWVGMLLLWPVLFFIIGGDHEEELAQIKGDHDAVLTLAIERRCGFTDEIEEREEDKAHE